LRQFLTLIVSSTCVPSGPTTLIPKEWVRVSGREREKEREKERESEKEREREKRERERKKEKESMHACTLVRAEPVEHLLRGTANDSFPVDFQNRVADFNLPTLECRPSLCQPCVRVCKRAHTCVHACMHTRASRRAGGRDTPSACPGQREQAHHTSTPRASPRPSPRSRDLSRQIPWPSRRRPASSPLRTCAPAAPAAPAGQYAAGSCQPECQSLRSHVDLVSAHAGTQPHASWARLPRTRRRSDDGCAAGLRRPAAATTTTTTAARRRRRRHRRRRVRLSPAGQHIAGHAAGRRHASGWRSTSKR
jgi:hypothetical protein